MTAFVKPFRCSDAYLPVYSNRMLYKLKQESRAVARKPRSARSAIVQIFVNVVGFERRVF